MYKISLIVLIVIKGLAVVVYWGKASAALCDPCPGHTLRSWVRNPLEYERFAYLCEAIN